jgi:serine/threonine-protein kinase
MLDGRYLVQGKIASGGTSTVYRGLDVRLDRPVALR